MRAFERREGGREALSEDESQPEEEMQTGTKTRRGTTQLRTSNIWQPLDWEKIRALLESVGEMDFYHKIIA